jgi:hypothetical protein
VALMGPGVSFAQDAMYFMAGAPAQQLPVLNNYGGFTCTMNPSTGTLTSGCLYTPPAVLSVATTTIITATSGINSHAAAQITLTVFPSNAIYVIPSKTSNYTDTSGNVWNARTGVDLVDNQGCCSCDNSASFSGTDVSLWNCQVGAASIFQAQDTHMNFVVPNGTYKVTYNYGTQLATGGQFVKLAVGNSEIAYNLDPSASAGGQFKNFTSTTTTVTNNQLLYGIYNMNDTGAPVSSLSIIPIASPVIFPYSELWTGTITATGKVTAQ